MDVHKYNWQNLFKILIYISLIIICPLFLINCEIADPVQYSDEKNISVSDGAPPLNEVDIENFDEEKQFENNFPQMSFKFGFDTAYYHADQDYYKSLRIELGEGSSFSVERAALTPPAGWPEGEDVIITMEAFYDPLRKEINYTFGPSGCHFDPQAELWLSWKTLQSANATLYYLNDKGQRIEHLPDNIDYVNKRMCIYIDHFSRYSVAYSD